ncbi:MAG TPA: alpha/beta fold hydrolase [Tepidisphaeraceae bacterium]|jgi:pimeloyl-ACP methyl ester carboxylesterase|nr:alpha/beta fold hydrolase [Tepidisphaeraceae bacterium]
MAWAELSDCRCYYEVLGTGEPLILIPGLAATTRMWDPVAGDLGQFFSVILFDNRGMGRSIALRKPTTLADLASDIVELLDHLQLDRVHVLGVSLGGVIAQRVAIDHPSRVDRLVLVSCADTFSPYLRQMSLLLAHTLRRFPREMFVRTMELLATAPEFLDANTDLVEERVKTKSGSHVSARAVGNQLRCLAASEVPAGYFKITAPTLVVAGEFDPIIPSCYSKQMADKIPASEYFLVRGAGHNPLVDHPQAVIPRVVEFLQESHQREETNVWRGAMERYAPHLGGV